MQRTSLRSIGLALFLGTGFLALAAGDRESPKRGVASPKSVDRIDQNRPWQHDDGRIQHRGRMFESWDAWRDANPEHDHRCGTAAPEIPPGGEGIAGLGDCSLTSTNPTDEYDPANMNFVIPVVVHVIMNDDGTMGDISRETIERQMVILNEDFSGQHQRWEDGLYHCEYNCEYSTAKLSDMRRHIEAKHEVSEGFTCPHCGFHTPTSNSLRMHISRKHKPREGRQ